MAGSAEHQLGIRAWFHAELVFGAPDVFLHHP